MSSTPLDTTIQISTPEFSEFLYYRASIFQRMLAYYLDHLCIILFFIIGFFALALFAGFTGNLADFFFQAGILGLIAVWWFYFILCEALANGQTLGKKILGIRVIGDKGTPITWAQSFIRNLIRIADMYPYLGNPAVGIVLPFFGVGFFTATATRKGQRLGDFAAGTMVVRVERKTKVERQDLDMELVSPVLAKIPKVALTKEESRILISYLHRRSSFSSARQDELATPFVEHLRQKFDIPNDITADLVMQACYVKYFGVVS